MNAATEVVRLALNTARAAVDAFAPTSALSLDALDTIDELLDCLPELFDVNADAPTPLDIPRAVIAPPPAVVSAPTAPPVRRAIIDVPRTTLPYGTARLNPTPEPATNGKPSSQGASHGRNGGIKAWQQLVKQCKALGVSTTDERRRSVKADVLRARLAAHSATQVGETPADKPTPPAPTVEVPATQEPVEPTLCTRCKAWYANQGEAVCRPCQYNLAHEQGAPKTASVGSTQPIPPATPAPRQGAGADVLAVVKAALAKPTLTNLSKACALAKVTVNLADASDMRRALTAWVKANADVAGAGMTPPANTTPPSDARTPMGRAVERFTPPTPNVRDMSKRQLKDTIRKYIDPKTNKPAQPVQGAGRDYLIAQLLKLQAGR